MLLKKKITQSEEIVVAAAIELFATQGYHGTSTREISKKSNFNVSVINYYFSSKEQLYITILKKIQLILEDTTLKFKSFDSYKQQLLSFIEFSCEFALTYSNLMKIFLQETIFNISSDSKKIFLDILQLHKNTFVNIIEIGNLNNEFSLGEETSHYYNFITGTIHNTWIIEQSINNNSNSISEKIITVKNQIICWLNLD